MNDQRRCWLRGCAQYGEAVGGTPACLMHEREPLPTSDTTACPYPEGREPVTYYADLGEAETDDDS